MLLMCPSSVQPPYFDLNGLTTCTPIRLGKFKGWQVLKRKYLKPRVYICELPDIIIVEDVNKSQRNICWHRCSKQRKNLSLVVWGVPLSENWSKFQTLWRTERLQIKNSKTAQNMGGIPEKIDFKRGLGLRKNSFQSCENRAISWDVTDPSETALKVGSDRTDGWEWRWDFEYCPP